MKGKNFSGNSNKLRNKRDLYETPYSITKQLLDREKFEGSILEPACGNGAIVKVLKNKDYSNITAYDMETNFFWEKNQFDNIITNPPYSQSIDYIIQAKRIAKKKIAMLLPLSYLHGQKRYNQLYNKQDDFPLTAVYVFTRYPMLGEPIREDGRYNTGMMVYAWFIWEKSTKQKDPIIKWINNNEFVLQTKKGQSV
jgi:hypothetical protein